MSIDIMRIEVPPDIIGDGYRRVDTKTEKWQVGDEWLSLSGYDWLPDDGLDWGRLIVRRKVEPKRVWTEHDIACCAEIRSKDLPQELIEEAVGRVVALFNADESRWEECAGGYKSKEQAASLPLYNTFSWLAEGWNRWHEIDTAPAKPKGRWIERKVIADNGANRVYVLDAGAFGAGWLLSSAATFLGFGGYRYGDDWTTALRFDERGVVVKPDAVRFWEDAK